MRYTLKFGSFFGIPVRIHFTFPLILVVFGLEAGLRGGWLEALWAVLLVLAVFVCVVLHEFGHSIQVRRYGIPVRDIVLLPIGGMARAERIPEDPRQEIVVAISGPLVNFALALIFFAIVWARQATLDFENDFLVNLLSINLVLGTFNLIPAFPMDGGRILRGLLAMRMPYLSATRHAKNLGQIIAILFVLVGFINTQFIMLPLIAVFIFFGAISEERMVRVRVGFDGKRVKDFLRANIPMFHGEDTVEHAASRVGRVDAFAFPVTDGYGSLAGAVERAELQAAMTGGRSGDPLRRYLKTGVPLIDGQTPAAQAYYFMRTQRLPLAGVVQDEIFTGLVFFEDLAAAIGRKARRSAT